MTEELKELRAECWRVIKRIDNILNMGGLESMEPKEVKVIEHTPERIIKEVCDYYNISSLDLTYTRRQGDFVKRRVITVKLLMDYTHGIPLIEITKMLGYKAHGTVLHHLRNANRVISGEVYDHNYIKRDYNAIKKRLEA